MSEYEKLKELISNSRISLLCRLVGAEEFNKDVGLLLDNDNSTPYEKGIEKYYSLNEAIYFKRDFRCVLSVDLIDFGVYSDGEKLEKCLGSPSGPLDLSIDYLDHYNSKVILKGSIFADLGVASSNHPIAKFEVFGITNKNYEKLELYKVLMLEAFIMELNGDVKIAFFNYFTALESYVSMCLDNYKEKIHSELHYALEHLGLDEKIKIVVKEGVKDLTFNDIPIWSKFQNAFKDVKDKRNKIAHARTSIYISDEDIDEVLFCICCLTCIINHEKFNFSDVRKFFFGSKGKK